MADGPLTEGQFLIVEIDQKFKLLAGCDLQAIVQPEDVDRIPVLLVPIFCFLQVMLVSSAVLSMDPTGNFPEEPQGRVFYSTADRLIFVPFVPRPVHAIPRDHLIRVLITPVSKATRELKILKVEAGVKDLSNTSSLKI